MRFFGKRSVRQQEIRRSKAERGLTWYHRFLEELELQPITFLTFCALVAALTVNAGQDALGIRLGQTLPRDVTSRLTFRLVDERATDRLRGQARDNADDYYELDVSLLQDLRGRLMSALRIAREQSTDPAKLKEKAAEVKLVLDEPGLAELLRLAELPDAAEFHDAVDRAVRALHRIPLVETSASARRRTGIQAVLVDPAEATEHVVPNSELRFANNAEHVNKVVEAAVAAAGFAPSLRESMRASLTQMLRGEGPDDFKPLYRHDTRRSARAAQEAESKVETQYNVFEAGARLAPAGKVTPAELELLRAEHKFFQNPDYSLQDAPTIARLAAVQDQALWVRWARAFTVFLLVFGIGGYIIVVHGDTLSSARRRLASALVLLATLAAARATYVSTEYVQLTVGLYAFAVALLAITSGSGTSYAAAGLTALVFALATRQGIAFAAVLVAVALVLFLGLRNVRNRGRIIAVGALAALAAALMTQLAGLAAGQDFTYVFWRETLWAALSTLAAAFIVEGILPAIERLFGITTNMTLLEWCDPNKPLMRMMAAESPGTYNHSLLVGTLADAAAEAIGANRLLARAGTYYHDIGKINKPEYFVENQAMGVVSRHERLSPAMSHLIIIGHVKDGIAMAKEYGVPESLHCFIPEHHGTCVVEYFYHAANRARKPGDPPISDEQFRYPGPKPQSRETAIVMLCDGVEGAVRAMPEPTPNRIEDTVAKIIQKRLMDGQLDECDLTFRELDIIRNTLVKSLCALYHARITYPSAETPEEAARSAS